MEYIIGAATTAVVAILGIAVNIYIFYAPRRESRRKNIIECARILDLYSFECANSVIETKAYESDSGDPAMTPVGVPHFDVSNRKINFSEIDPKLYSKLVNIEIRSMHRSIKINRQLQYVNPDQLSEESIEYCTELGRDAHSLSRNFRDSISVPNPEKCFLSIFDEHVS